MNSGFIEYNHGKLYFEDNGSGKPIVFIHGFSLDHRMWDNQKEYFSKKYQVITYDLRGFGQSSLPDCSYSHHDDLNAILNYLNIKASHIVGLSLGGEIALDFVLSYPKSVLSLTLIDSSLGGFVGKVDWDVKAKELGLEKAKDNWLHHPVFAPTIAKSDVRMILGNIVKNYSGWHWVNHDPRTKLNPLTKDRLTEIKIPVEILVGSEDLGYYHDIASFVAKSINDSRLITVPNSGHMVNLEQPELTNSIIENFVAS